MSPSGQLEVGTPIGSLAEEVPFSYQDAEGRRVQVPTSYAIDRGPSSSYRFRLGEYNPTKPLVIDPVVLVYAGYVGGADDDFGAGMAVDASGAAYVTGDTASSEDTFPVRVGPDLTHNGTVDFGVGDAFVAKVVPSGKGLDYAGYIGGEVHDVGTGIAVDGSGSAHVTGFTTSTEATFPVKGGPT